MWMETVRKCVKERRRWEDWGRDSELGAGWGSCDIAAVLLRSLVHADGADSSW